MFKEKLDLVPHLPGSYQMKDKNGIIIYVGKAKDLKNRLSSYFTGRVTGKTKKLVSEIADFEYIVTSSELESFILEINYYLNERNSNLFIVCSDDDLSFPAKPTKSCHDFIFFQFGGFLQFFQTQNMSVCLLEGFVNFTSPGAN